MKKLEIQNKIQNNFRNRTVEQLKNDVTVLFADNSINSIVLRGYAIEILTEKIGEEQTDLFVDELYKSFAK
jgi:hypothetical protein